MDINPAAKRVGGQTVMFSKAPVIASYAAIAGDMEGDGWYGEHFDIILEDDLWGEESWEKSEAKMFEQVVRLALQKGNLSVEQVDVLLGGDLLNQIISANYAARQLEIPFFGLYGACSTMSESLLLGSMLVEGGFSSLCACATSSHFSSAERQYRNPLELGSQRPPTAQRTITGSGCAVLANDTLSGARVVVAGGTIGKVIDLGVTDVNNMGAAMAPAAADTIVMHLQDTGRTVDDYDLIVTGDLGKYGRKLCDELCAQKSVYFDEKHFDCGERIFKEEQDTHAGGSGCGCAGIMLNGYLLKRMIAGDYNRILFMATGALMNPGISQQGESIPSIAHAIVLERRT